MNEIELYKSKPPTLTGIVANVFSIDNKPKTIRELSKEQTDISGFISVGILSIFDFYGVTITEFQGKTLVNFILEKGYYLTKDDILLFVKKALNRDYTPKYKLEVTDIQDWFFAYLDERIREIEKFKYLQNKEPVTEPVEMSEGSKKILRDLAEKLKPTREAVKPGTLQNTKAMTASLIYSEFLKIKETQGGKDKITVNGKEYNSVEYLDFKLKL